MPRDTLRHLVALLLLAAAAVYLTVTRLEAGGTTNRAAAPNSVIGDTTFWHRTQSAQRLTSRYPLTLDHDLTALPLEIGGWRGEAIPQSNVNALIMLDPEQFIERVYTNEQGQIIWLTLIGSRKSQSFHPPVACYDADGWASQLRASSIPVGEGSINVMLVEAEIAERGYYHVSSYFYLFPDSNRNPQDGIVMFRVTSPPYGSVGDTLALQGEFLTHIFEPPDENRLDGALRVTDPPPTTDRITLDGFRLSHRVVAAGGAFGVTLHWKTDDAPTRDVEAHIRLVGRDNPDISWSYPFNLPPQGSERAAPTTSWPPGSHVTDSLEVRLLEGIPPGRYDVELTVTAQETGALQSFFGPDGAFLGTRYLLGDIDVASADHQPAFVPSQPLDETVALHRLRLLGFTQDNTATTAGDVARLSLFWEKIGRWPLWALPPLTLHNTDGRTVQEWSVEAGFGGFALNQWRAGERIRSQHDLWLERTLPSGTYTLHVGRVTVGSLQIEAPARMFEPPPIAVKRDITFGDFARLTGYQVMDKEVRLLWQPLRETERAWHVFVHIVDAGGAILQQSDGIPARGTRPTAGWVPAEFIVDTHVLTALDNANAASLRVGIYDPDTGERLSTGDETFAELTLGD